MSFYTAKIEILQKQIETVQEEIEKKEKEIESVEKELESIVSKKFESWKLLYDLKKEKLDDLRQQNAHCHLVNLVRPEKYFITVNVDKRTYAV